MKTQKRHAWHFVIAVNPKEDMSMRHRRNLFLGMFLCGIIGVLGLAAGPVGAAPGRGGQNTCSTQLATCTANLNACQAEPVCGDGIVEAGEDCDVGTLNGMTCQGEGFAGGTLACGTGCTFDTSKCFADRFVDNGDGTITDHQTGLMWQKQLGGTSWEFDSQGVGNCRNCVNDYYTWTVAMSEWLSALNGRTNNQNTQPGYAGYSDWRLPTIVELKTILDTSAGGCGGGSGPCVNAIFNDSDSFTAAYFYWSSTSIDSYPHLAWVVGFGNGVAGGGGKSANADHVRAVRGGL